MRRFTHRLMLLTFVLSLVLIGSPDESVTEAATTTVNSEAELVAAINAANANLGPDTIVLGSDIGLATTTPFVANGENGLPSITSEVIIQGNGHRIVRTSAVEFRLFHVGITGSLWLDQVTLARGTVSTSVVPNGGAIYSVGLLIVTRSTIGGSGADGNSASNGGGIWAQGRTIIVASNISFNSVTGYGGGIYTDQTPLLQIIYSQIDDNRATLAGGGIGCECTGTTTVEIRHSQINNNTVDGTNFSSGGGIYMDSDYHESNLRLLRSQVVGNTATTTATQARGGGIYFYGNISGLGNSSSLTILDSAVSDNRLIGNGSIVGAGMYMFSADTTISYSVFDSNVGESTIISPLSTVQGGGLFLGLYEPILISNSTISNNRAEMNYSGGSAWCCGGGIYSEGVLTIVNTTISSNGSYNSRNVLGMRGGGLTLTGPTTIINSTIINNQAVPAGEGGGVAKSARTPVTFANTILANNVAASGPDCIIFFGPQTDFMSDGYNLFSDTIYCTGLPRGDDFVGTATMGPLADNGGPTMTHLPLAAPPLNSGNPATDPTPPANGIACPSIDQRGAPRNVDRCDIGAVESGVNPPVYNVPPNGVDDGVYNTPQDTPITVPATGLLANDSDPDDSIIYAYPQTPPTNGYVTINVDGSFTYTPHGGFTGIDTFTYVVCDERGTCDTTPPTVTIQVGTVVAPIYNSNPAPTTPVAINTTVNITGSAQIVVTNTGTDILQITGIALTGDPEITTITAPFSIDVGGAAVMIGLECTSATANTFTATLTVTHNDPNSPATYPITCMVTDDPVDPPDPPDPPDPDPPAIVVFDPAISKIGELGPGQLGLTGEQLVWTTTVSNPTSVVGTNIVITDTLRPELQIDSVDADRGTVSVSGQTVTITIAVLNLSESVQVRITTTVLSSPNDGLFTNTIWLNADGNIRRSATATLTVPIGLPNTGYPPRQNE